MKSLLVLAACSFVVACGGPAKPPENTPDATAKSADSSVPATKPPGPNEGPVAKSNSDDVTKGVQLLKGGDLNGARSAFEAAIAKNPKQADAHYYLGVVLDQSDKKADAEKEYKMAFELAPDLQEAAANLVAIYVEGKKWDDAINVAKTSLGKNPKNADMHLNYAAALAGKGDQPGASKEYEEAIKLQPNDARFYFAYGHTQAEWKKRDEAVATLKKGVNVADDPGMLAGMAVDLKSLREFPACVSALDKAIAQKDAAELRVYRGSCKLGSKDLPGALDDFRAAVQKDAKFAPAHYSLGNALADSGKLDEAITEWDTYLKLAPGAPNKPQVEKKIALAKSKLKK
jgi:tetratricopeptide (TPR) repeat protein